MHLSPQRDDPQAFHLGRGLTVRIRRCAHFVPGANDKMPARALDSAADALVLDLGDAGLPERKDHARPVIAGALADADSGGHERIVRIKSGRHPVVPGRRRNPMVHPPDAYLVPEAHGPGDVRLVGRLVESWSSATATASAAPR